MTPLVCWSRFPFSSLALLDLQDVLLSAIAMWLTICVPQSDIAIEIDGAAMGTEKRFETEQINIQYNKAKRVYLGRTHDDHLTFV